MGWIDASRVLSALYEVMLRLLVCSARLTSLCYILLLFRLCSSPVSIFLLSHVAIFPNGLFLVLQLCLLLLLIALSCLSCSLLRDGFRSLSPSLVGGIVCCLASLLCAVLRKVFASLLQLCIFSLFIMYLLHVSVFRCIGPSFLYCVCIVLCFLLRRRVSFGAYEVLCVSCCL